MTTIDLGIDLGTTNSVVTVWWNSEPLTLQIQNRMPRELMSSTVLFTDQGILVGEQALSRALLFPDRLVRSIKTDMGTTIKRTFDRDYLPEDISAIILKELISRAVESFASTTGVTDAVVDNITVTVPARFNLKAVQATRKSAAMCGFSDDRIQILRESDASALAYIRGDPKPQTVLIFDLGGGTFDLSVLRFTGVAPSFFEHLGPPGGDPRLGGDVFDSRVFDRMAIHAMEHGLSVDLRQPVAADGYDEHQWLGARERLLQEARLWKEAVCDPGMPEDYEHEAYYPELLGQMVTRPFAMNRLGFSSLIADKVDDAFAELHRLLEELDLDKGDIDRVVLAGGSSRIPIIKTRLREYFGFQPNDTLATDKAVSIGASVYSRFWRSLTENERKTVIPPSYLTVPVGLRVTRQISESLSLADARSEFEPILERGLLCPDERTKTFTTVRHNQETLRFEVYVQEGGTCHPDNFVSFFELTLPREARRPRGVPKIDVRFGVDGSGSQLMVQAVERRTGVTITEIARIDDRAQVLPEQSALSDITLDEFGNPEGLQHDLGGQLNDICEGKRILLYSSYDPTGHGIYVWQDAADAVAERGFAMDIWLRHERGSIDDLDLSPYDELWFISGHTATVTPPLIDKIDSFLQQGKGLLIWTDNAPYFADGNILAEKFAESTFSGYHHGDKVLQPSETHAAGYFIDHPLTSGLNNLYEGITISEIHPGPGVDVLAHGSDGHPCMAVFDNGRYRVALDTGFTKLYQEKFNHTAGTARYFRNIAFWLLPESRPYT